MQSIHQSPRYVAYLHPRAGLIVQSTHRFGGIQMKPDHPQFTDYVEGLKMAIDQSEGDALCRALLN